ncbi:MAG: hypothetical protein U5K69_24960 [Balneolaceae bacterium]|nr:hypothetical protein [Balneolaceae bacterium]
MKKEAISMQTTHAKDNGRPRDERKSIRKRRNTAATILALG